MGSFLSVFSMEAQMDAQLVESQKCVGTIQSSLRAGWTETVSSGGDREIVMAAVKSHGRALESLPLPVDATRRMDR